MGAHRCQPARMEARAQKSALLLLALLHATSSSFVYPDFNETQGLTFNGHASTTSCVDNEVLNAAGDVQGDADQRESEIGSSGSKRERERAEGSFQKEAADARGHFLSQALKESADSSPHVVGSGATHVDSTRTTTDDPEETGRIGRRLAGFGHRDDYVPAKDHRCAGRVRLTPSNPSTVGATWYHLPVAVNEGFETIFTFQISDHSRECTTHKDPEFSTIMYESCQVHGGDGFAFVVHRDANDTRAMGQEGRGLGYAGIRNSLAVEFDTFYNPNGLMPSKPMGSDLFTDHVAVHSRGGEPPRHRSSGAAYSSSSPSVASGRGVPNSDDEAWALGQQRPHQIADGKHHTVKVTYLPYVAMEYLSYFTASPHLVPFLKDDSEGRRLGTLLVFLDGGVAADEPLLALPLNLGVLLALPQDQAYVGFTASTGLKWEKHDILSWVWCARVPCTAAEHVAAHSPHLASDGGGDGSGGASSEGHGASFDYAQASHRAAAGRASHSPPYVPGDGYGGGGIGGGSTSAAGAGPKIVPGGGGGGAASTRQESPDAPLLEARADSRNGVVHGHGAAAFVPLNHHSEERNEGLLSAYTASSKTFSTLRGHIGGSNAQIPRAHVADGKSGSEEERAHEGTEIR